MPKSGVQSEESLASIKSKPGSVLSQGDGVKLIKLVGKRGSGKSRFYLSDLARVAEDIATNEHGRAINWKSQSDCDWVEKEIAPKICMRIIDMDMKGVEELIARPAIVPPPLTDCIEKWGVTGIPEKDIDAYEEAQLALTHYLQQLEDHARKYPEYRFARFLVLESEETLYTKGKDHYVKITYAAEGASDTSELMLLRRETQNRTGKFATLFRSGPREEFGQGIYPMVSKYLTLFVAFSGDVGFNVYMTAHVIEKTLDYGKDTQRQVDIIAGAPNLSDGYFDAILLFEKIVTKNDDNTKKSEYYISTETSLSKNRMSDDITMQIIYTSPGSGPRAFWNQIKTLRLEES
jgi:hypothetical protein